MPSDDSGDRSNFSVSKRFKFRFRGKKKIFCDDISEYIDNKKREGRLWKRCPGNLRDQKAWDTDDDKDPDNYF